MDLVITHELKNISKKEKWFITSSCVTFRLQMTGPENICNGIKGSVGSNIYKELKDIMAINERTASI